jgi:CheY-like chemotaxis protein
MRTRPLVLLVDDEDAFLEIASMRLADHFDTEQSHDAEEALQKAISLRPDLVLSDVFMPPGPNGWKLAFALRDNSETRGIPFAFFTSLRDPWIELTRSRFDADRELGSVTIVSKTEDVDRLAERVMHILGKN